jgi:exopolysaccharide biosynthesis polyprenyl glycosylphosphotransferase
MFTYRLHGLLNLYLVATTVLVGGLFLGFAVAIRFIPWLSLSAGVSLNFCVAAIALGMVANGPHVLAMGARLNQLGWPEAVRLAVRQVALIALALFTLVVATKDHSISRLFLAHYLVLTWMMLVFANRWLPGYLALLAFDRNNQLPTVFVGNFLRLEKLSKWIDRTHYLGINPVGSLSDDCPDEGNAVTGPCLGPISRLAQVIAEQHIAQVILLNVPASVAETRSIIGVCQSAGCRVLVYDDVSERLPFPMVPLVEDGQSFYALREEPLEDPSNRLIKRAYDVALSLPVVLFILPPLCALVGVFQFFQAPGPLFFIRPRGGRQRTEFGMLKFRSMNHTAVRDEANESVQVRRGDERIYPFGRFLRKTSLDEFPQFLNVLMGEMSIVGPRPHLPTHDREFSRVATQYRTRHLVKPGITGLAQVRGLRGEIDDPALLHHRVELDIFYIRRWSILLDLQITLQTFLQIFFPPQSAN